MRYLTILRKYHMHATEAPCCRLALTQATETYPHRSTKSDGIMGDLRHQRHNPRSDHNFGNAFDLTHDPVNGVDCEQLATAVMSDARVKYIIWNKAIFTPS